MSHLTNSPSRKRKYTPEQKAQFFAIFERLGSMSAAAREAGLPIGTCYQWLVKAGVEVKRVGPERREEYSRLRADGVHRRDAALRVGVNVRTAADWDQGIRHARNRRVYPDGRVIDYNSGVTTMSPSATGLPVLQQRINPRFLSLEERETIRDMSAVGASLRSIAAALLRAPSTISRELARNSRSVGSYRPLGSPLSRSSLVA